MTSHSHFDDGHVDGGGHADVGRRPLHSRRARIGGLAAAGAALLGSAGIVVVGTPADAATGCRVAYTVNDWGSGGFGASLTVTNLGEQGVPIVYGVIYPPQVALVGFGKIVERPWATGGLLGVRPVMTATLAANHRVSDGHRGGIFLAAIEHLLQEPEKL